ncbi:hypothetical protein FVE85_7241 [Porphyridium purpureum]|uniref:Uncharacterized protein n=1 Tax=Porphyridium purpureum TaxID=35688 RepID=A0A5J4Z7H3_PORPP|nr:hypothetical protein FVE85_7241 [Porphyridium purpureum]|eukprot:POR1067..scf295_1
MGTTWSASQFEPSDVPRRAHPQLSVPVSVSLPAPVVRGSDAVSTEATGAIRLPSRTQVELAVAQLQKEHLQYAKLDREQSAKSPSNVRQQTPCGSCSCCTHHKEQQSSGGPTSSVATAAADSDVQWTFREPPRLDHAKESSSPVAHMQPHEEGKALTKEGQLELMVVQWEHMFADIVCSLALSPQMLSWYAEALSDFLTRTLLSSHNVQHVNFVQCSFPCLKSEKPKMRLVRWEGMHDAEFEVDWNPRSWWLAVSVGGALNTQLIVTIRGLGINGNLRTALASDCSAIRLSFCADRNGTESSAANTTPEFRMTATTRVVLGSVPLPVQNWTEDAVLRRLRELFNRHLVGPNECLVPLRRTVPSRKVTEAELASAQRAAARARTVNLNA